MLEDFKVKSMVWSFKANRRYKTLCSEMFVLVKNAAIKCYWWMFKFLVFTQKIYISHLLKVKSSFGSLIVKKKRSFIITHTHTPSNLAETQETKSAQNAFFFPEADFIIGCILRLDAGCPLLDSKQVLV